jgi:hypothetical protein
MEDKILKQIEEEALKLFPLDEYDDELFSERYNWRNGAKFGYNIKENVNEQMLEALKRINDCSLSKQQREAMIESAILSASKNTVSNEGEKERLIDFLCYLNDNKMINNYDFDYEQQASEYLSAINPPK